MVPTFEFTLSFRLGRSRKTAVELAPVSPADDLILIELLQGRDTLFQQTCRQLGMDKPELYLRLLQRVMDLQKLGRDEGKFMGKPFPDQFRRKLAKALSLPSDASMRQVRQALKAYQQKQIQAGAATVNRLYIDGFTRSLSLA